MANTSVNPEVAVIHLDEALHPKPQAKETDVERHFMAAFEALGCGPSAQHTTPSGGAADVYVTDYQLVVEIKRPGQLHPTRRGHRRKDQDPGAVTTQADQLHSYVAELAAEQESRSGPSRHCWWGILTDGVSGYVYQYGKDGKRPKHLTKLDWPITGQKAADLIAQLRAHPLRTQTGRPHAGRHIYRHAFADFHERIIALRRQLYKQWNDDQYQAHVGTKYDLWSRQMERSGLVPKGTADSEDMFTRHTLLVSIAHLVNATINQASPPDRTNHFHGIGDGFTAWLVEDSGGRRLIDELWSAAENYDWLARPQDVLRHLYQDCIPSDQRKLFGEFYTPDWLAEMLVQELLDNEWCEKAIKAALAAIRHDDPALLHGIGVLDPTCGSGTFLYHAARRLARHPLWEQLGLSHTATGKLDMANAIASLVVGIDIHPVAVTMARASVRRALPVAPTIPLLIAEGDSLLADDSLGDLGRSGIRYKTPGENDLNIPPELTSHSRATQHVRTIVDHADSDGIWPEQDLPPELRTSSMRKMFDQLYHICKVEHNSVWSWFITGLLHPHQTQTRRMDRIVGNPPWVVFSSLNYAPRQKQIRTMAKQLGVHSGRSVSGFDICTIFLKRVWREFVPADSPARAAFVTSYALQTGENWKPYRDTSPELARIIDLQHLKEPPFTGAASAVALLEQPHQRRIEQPIPVDQLQTTKRQRIRRSQTWHQIQPLLRTKRTSTEPYPVKPSAYRPKQWNQGPILVPHCLVKLDPGTIRYGSRNATATTAPSRHLPWRNVPVQEVTLPNEWIVPVITSGSLHPFSNSPPSYFIVPQVGGTLLTHAKVTKNRQWRELDDIYRKHAGVGKNTPKTLRDHINFQGKSQIVLTRAFGAEYIVTYNTSGLYCKSNVLHRQMIDTSLYASSTTNQHEAKYLSTILNANCLQDALRSSRKSDRHFHTHLWVCIPIPRFDVTNSLHTDIAACYAPAHSIAEAHLDPTFGTLKQDKAIREALRTEGIMLHIDKLLRKLLPEHTT